MSDESTTPQPLKAQGRASLGLRLAFLLFLALWTWKLLEPQPVPEVIRGGLGVDWAFFLAKTLHGGAYAFLMVLGAAAFPYRVWWVVALLAWHGVLTEFGQTFVPNRFGSVRDVLIDWGGIAGGLVALRWLWKR
jgi:hypothetical protein